MNNVTCMYCGEYREYCKCQRENMTATKQDTHLVGEDVKKILKKLDRILEVLESQNEKIEL